MRVGAQQQMSLGYSASPDVQGRLKVALADAMKSSHLSREQIAEAMVGRLAAVGAAARITPTMLDRWAAPSDLTHNIPTHLLPAFCQVTQSIEPLAILATALGFGLAGDRELYLIALGEAQYASMQASKKRKAAVAGLEELR